MSPQPRDEQLYKKVKKTIYKKYPKHSAYRSGILVQTYKKEFEKKYRSSSPSSAYIGQKPRNTGLSRWYKENWTNQRGEVGYTYKSDIYRPTKKITRKTPLTFSELSKKEISRARRIKSKDRRIDRFRY